MSSLSITLLCYILIFSCFALGDYYLSPYYAYFSSARLLPITSWLLPRVILLHFICFFVWIVGSAFRSLEIPLQYHSRLVAFYTQTVFHLIMKWTTIVASFIFPRYLYIYFLVFSCWFVADWTCIVARIESKLHPQPGHRSFLVRVSRPIRITFALLGLAAVTKHFFLR